MKRIATTLQVADHLDPMLLTSLRQAEDTFGEGFRIVSYHSREVGPSRNGTPLPLTDATWQAFKDAQP